jgi:oligogalacturonide lyase
MQYIHLFSVGLLLTLAAPMGAQQEPPKSWVDPDTGHRIVRLTDEPDSASLYFNQNGYTADGKQMVFTTANGISVLDLTTHAARPVVQGQVRIIVTGRKTQNVYYGWGSEGSVRWLESMICCA